MIFALICYIIAILAIVFVLGDSWRRPKKATTPKPLNNPLYVATAALEHDLGMLPHIDEHVQAACTECNKPLPKSSRGNRSIFTPNENRIFLAGDYNLGYAPPELRYQRAVQAFTLYHPPSICECESCKEKE